MRVKFFDITLSLNAGAAYAAGDVLADTQPIHDAVGRVGGEGTLHSILLLDKDDRAQALDLIFLDSNVTIGTENAAVSITDANAEKIVAAVEIASGDYIDLVNSQIVQKGPEQLGQAVRAVSGTRDLFVAAVSRGTGTYTASGIMLKIGILTD